MKIDGLGNVYVTGKSDSVSSTGCDIVTIKYKPDGSIEWINSFDYNRLTDNGNFLVIDGSGNIYVIGTVSVTYTDISIIVIKYKPNGTKVWAKRFAPSGYGKGRNQPLRVTIDNNYIYITGYVTEAAPYNNLQLVLFKLDFNASFSSVVYGSLGKQDIGIGVDVDPAGNIYVTGSTLGTTTSSKGVVIKYNPSLTAYWTKIISDTLRTITYLRNIKLNSEGRVIVAGMTDTISYSRSNCILSELNPADGSISWYRRIIAPGLSFSLGTLSIDPGDNMILGTTYSEFVTYKRRNTVFKYHDGGIFLWSKKVDSIDNIHAICTDPASNIYVSGFAQDEDGKCFARLSPAGNIDWYGSLPYAIDGWKIEFINTEELYVAGIYRSTSSYPDNNNFLTAKFKVVPSGKPLLKGNLSEFRLGSNYPNTFNPVTEIRYSIPVNSNVILKVYDNIGREVALLVNGNMEAGEHEVSFDASNFASGVYFYKLESGAYSEIKKMILIK
jgi:hypothetical protein